jgi:hypothetical protein
VHCHFHLRSHLTPFYGDGKFVAIIFHGGCLLSSRWSFPVQFMLLYFGSDHSRYVGLENRAIGSEKNDDADFSDQAF